MCCSGFVFRDIGALEDFLLYFHLLELEVFCLHNMPLLKISVSLWLFDDVISEVLSLATVQLTPKK